MTPASATVTVRVLRSPTEPGGESHYQAYEVATYPRMSVLDALFQIQRDHDRSLAFRCSCRLGMCGTCAMIINNREGLACQTQISRFRDGEITIRPMNYLPVVKDLTVDMEPFFDRYRSVKPFFVPSEATAQATTTQVIKQSSGDRKWVDPALGCITCGICNSACSVVGLNSAFPGPAALNRAYTLTNDVRDGAREERLAAVGGDDGVWRCHQLFNCANACPRHLVPTQAIRQLRVEAGSTNESPLAAPLRWLRGKKALPVVSG